ncbi:MAG: hypothetical protein ACI4WO_06800, partial [Porcipelethomonas sp.]
PTMWAARRKSSVPARILQIKTKKILKEIDKGKFLQNCGCCGNIFEEVTQLEDVFNIKNFMKKHGADAAVMSGSGSSVFGIFNNEEAAKKCAEELKRIYPFAEYCRAVTQSIAEVKV